MSQAEMYISVEASVIAASNLVPAPAGFSFTGCLVQKTNETLTLIGW